MMITLSWRHFFEKFRVVTAEYGCDMVQWLYAAFVEG